MAKRQQELKRLQPEMKPLRTLQPLRKVKVATEHLKKALPKRPLTRLLLKIRRTTQNLSRLKVSLRLIRPIMSPRDLTPSVTGSTFSTKVP